MLGVALLSQRLRQEAVFIFQSSRLMLRSVPRVILALLFVGTAVTCSESPTRVQRKALRVAFAPQFSPQAKAIYERLAAFAVTLDNVHVVVRGVTTDETAGPVLKDTTI